MPSIPVVLFGVIFLMPVKGVYLDIISLTAMLIVIGIIVDDGIIVSENIVKHREKNENPLQPASRGISKVFKPVVTTLLTTFLAFAPMFYMKGIVGEFIRIIPLVISLALFMSLLELVIALPAHVKGGLDKIDPRKKKIRSWFQFIEKWFRKSIVVVLKRRYLFILFSICLFAGSVFYAVRYMDFVLFPGSAADTFNIYIDLPVDTSIERTFDKVKEIENLIEKIPDSEMDSYATRVGSHSNRYFGESENWAFIRVNLVPFAKRQRSANEIVDNLQKQNDELQGFTDIVYEIVNGLFFATPLTLALVPCFYRVRADIGRLFSSNNKK